MQEEEEEPADTQTAADARATVMQKLQRFNDDALAAGHQQFDMQFDTDAARLALIIASALAIHALMCSRYSDSISGTPAACQGSCVMSELHWCAKLSSSVSIMALT